MKPITLVITTFWLFCVHSAWGQKPAQFVIKPTKGEGPYPVAVWLHGYRGYSADGYFPGKKRDELQKHANATGAVIVGFPATTDLGDGTQQWSEEPVADQAYIQYRLSLIAKTTKLDLKRVVLFGFSQGAMVAGDLASIFPNSYLGAILMSPGGIGDPKASGVKLPGHARQTYFCFCGAKEHDGNVGLTKAYAGHFKNALGAKTILKLYPGVEKHTRPPDFMEQFPNWIKLALDHHREAHSPAKKEGGANPATIPDPNSKKE